MNSAAARRGDIFFALPGQNFHGAQFAKDAVSRGAAAVVSQHSQWDSALSELPAILVPDVVRAMSALAVWCRKQSAALVIGVTGSVGKTTTRQMIAAVMTTEYKGIQSPGNYNNHLGVPLTLMLLDENSEFAVLEIGASAAGEIASLAAVADPEFAVITRIAPAHLDGFGDIDGVQRAKGELAEAVRSDGILFLNGDDQRVRSMGSRTSARTLLYGQADDCDFRVTEIRAIDGAIHFCVNNEPYELPCAGRHQVNNAAAAIAVGRTAGISAEHAASALRNCLPAPGRGQVVCNTPWTIIDDSYNASPVSVKASVDHLSSWTSCRHRILVLADMLELGEKAEQFHFQAGEEIGRSGIDHVLLLGDWADVVAEGVRSVQGSRAQSKVSVFRDLDTLLIMLDCLAGYGDVILVKGSRGMKMERVVNALMSAAAALPRKAA